MWGQLLGGALGVYGAVQGAKNDKKSNEMADRALKQRELEYNQRAPLRRQGMQALGQVEAPIDFGTQFHSASNPFSAARGPAPSTASYGDWGRMTTTPEATDQALSGVSPQQIQDAQDAMSGTLIGKSGGKQRFLTSSGRQVTNQDRERAIQVLGQYDTQVGFARPRSGVQPLGGGR